MIKDYDLVIDYHPGKANVVKKVGCGDVKKKGLVAECFLLDFLRNLATLSCLHPFLDEVLHDLLSRKGSETFN